MAALPRVSEAVEIQYDAKLRGNTRTYTESSSTGLVPPRPEWFSQARCVGCDPNLFFPPSGANVDSNRAKLICQVCPVKAECLEYAIVNHEKTGVWGGTGEVERRRIRRGRRLLKSDLHGERACYQSGCHCDECTAANTAYEAARRETL